ncbi:MAG: STAS/SEC14 domain-containing protein [Sandaracinaceae bacterium]
MVDAHWLDESRHPIWIQTIPEAPELDEFMGAFEHFDRRIREAATRTERLGLVVDMRKYGMGTSIQRQRAAKTNELAERLLGSRILGQAVVMESAMQRGALTAVQWLARPTWPVRTFAERSEAIDWLRGLL